MNSQFLSFFKQSQVLLEYSEPFINKFAIKLAASVNDATRVEEFKRYIRFFDTIRNTNGYQTYVKNNPEIFSRNNIPIADPKNVDLFNAAQLEHIYDQFCKQEESESQQEITKDASLIWPEDVSTTIRDNISPVAAASNDDKYIEVYLAGNAAACIKFSHDVFNHSYSFCIGRKTNHMYDTYRYQEEDPRTKEYTGPRTFYFVRDYSRSQSDPLHLIVVHAMKSGKFRFTNAPNNNADAVVGDWDALLRIQPKLHNLKDKIKFIPLSVEEEDYITLKYNDMWDFNQISPRLKNAALSSGIVFPVHIFTQLSAEEQNTYIVSQTALNNIVFISKYTPTTRNWEKRSNHISKNCENFSNILKTAITDTDLGIKPAAELIDLSLEYTQNMGGMSYVNSFLLSLILLSVNTKYYVDEDGNCIPRKEKRTQPLKYFIQKTIKTGPSVVNHNDIDTILNTPYNKTSTIPAAGLVANGRPAAEFRYDLDNYTSITCGSSSLLLINKNKNNFTDSHGYKMYTPVYTPTCIILNNETGKISYTALTINGISKYGFLVKDETVDDTKNGSPNFLLNINKDTGEIETIVDFDKQKIAEEDNYAGPLVYSTFKSFSKEIQNTMLLKRLKFAFNECKKYADEDSYYYIINGLRDNFMQQDDEDYFNFYKSEMTKSSIFNVATTRQEFHEFCGDTIPAFAAIYYLCKSVSTQALNYYIDNIESNFYEKAIKHSYSPVHSYSRSNIVGDRIVSAVSRRGVSLMDWRHYKVVLSGVSALYTKKQIIIMPVSAVKGIEKAVGINKETLEFTSPEVLQKIKNTIKEIYKLKKNEAADVIATTMIEYDLNSKLVSDIVKKTKINITGIKYPLYPAKSYGITANSSTVIVNTQGNHELQTKYLKLLNFSQKYSKYLLQKLINILNLGNIELAQVIVKSAKDWRTGMSTDIGFCFLKRGSNLKTPEDTKAAFNTNSLYFDAKQIHITVPSSDSSTLKVRDSFFNTDAEIFTNINPQFTNIYMRLNSVFKSKKIKLASLMNKLTNPNLINDVIAFSPPIEARELKRTLALPARVKEESLEIPFKLFFKLLS